MKRRIWYCAAVVTILCALLIHLVRLESLDSYFAQSPVIELKEIEFEGQQRHLTVSNPEVISYLSKCFQQRMLDKHVAGSSYEVKFVTKNQGTLHTSAYVDESMQGLSISRRTIWTDIGLDDAKSIFVPFGDPKPPKLSEALRFLNGKKELDGKTLKVE